MSELRAGLISNESGSGPVTFNSQWAARAFVQYDQVSNVVDNSGNISSVTDTATGEFDPIFNNAFTTNVYCITGCPGVDATASPPKLGFETRSTSTCSHETDQQGSSTNIDCVNGVAYLGEELA